MCDLGCRCNCFGCRTIHSGAPTLRAPTLPQPGVLHFVLPCVNPTYPGYPYVVPAGGANGWPLSSNGSVYVSAA